MNTIIDTKKWTPQRLRAVRDRLVQWYGRNHRQLPWRETKDPYAIWVSEIMLQQTQVVTVLGYYARFLDRFPDVESLAAAEEQEVYGLWSGLGYYRRARQMHAAAKKIVDECNGQFPRQLAAIEDLPGIGRYTAGAIASFAFDVRAPIVEANTARLFSRLMAIRQPIQERPVQTQLWRFAEALLPSGAGSGVVNQASMELGSQVCAPTPACERCPLTQYCLSFQRGLQHQLPPVQPRPAPTPLTHVALWVEKRNQLLLRQNVAGEWWHGLWDLPRLDLTSLDLFDFVARPTKPVTRLAIPLTSNAKQAVSEGYRERYGIEVEPISQVFSLQHSVTRYRISLYCVSAQLTMSPSQHRNKLPEEWSFHPIDALPPLTAPAKNVVQRLLQKA